MDILRALIGPDTGDATAPQLCLRAALLLLFGVACVHIAGRRTFAQASPLGIIVALIVGSNLSRAMTGKAPFWPALAATLTLVVLGRLLAMASLRWGLPARWLRGDPVVLVRDGVEDPVAMRRHGVSRADLLEGLRMEQAEQVGDVRLATLEGGGRISVIPKASARG